MPELEAAACSLAAHRKKVEEQNRNNSGFGNVASSELKREIADNGAFVRQKNRFDTPFGNESGHRYAPGLRDRSLPSGFSGSRKT